MKPKEILSRLNLKSEIKQATEYLTKLKLQHTMNTHNTTTTAELIAQARTAAATYNAPEPRTAEQLIAKSKAAVASAQKSTVVAKAVVATAPQAGNVNLVKFVETQLAPMSRSEFDKMSPKGKAEFSRAGGRLVN